MKDKRRRLIFLGAHGVSNAKRQASSVARFAKQARVGDDPACEAVGTGAQLLARARIGKRTKFFAAVAARYTKSHPSQPRRQPRNVAHHAAGARNAPVLDVVLQAGQQLGQTWMGCISLTIIM